MVGESCSGAWVSPCFCGRHMDIATRFARVVLNCSCMCRNGFSPKRLCSGDIPKQPMLLSMQLGDTLWGYRRLRVLACEVPSRLSCRPGAGSPRRLSNEGSARWHAWLSRSPDVRHHARSAWFGPAGFRPESVPSSLLEAAESDFAAQGSSPGRCDRLASCEQRSTPSHQQVPLAQVRVGSSYQQVPMAPLHIGSRVVRSRIGADVWATPPSDFACVFTPMGRNVRHPDRTKFGWGLSWRILV